MIVVEARALLNSSDCINKFSMALPDERGINSHFFRERTRAYLPPNTEEQEFLNSNNIYPSLEKHVVH